MLVLFLSSSAQADLISAVRVNALNGAGNGSFYSNSNFSSNNSSQWCTEPNSTNYDFTNGLNPVMLCDLGAIQTITSITLSPYNPGSNNIKGMTVEFYDSPAIDATPVYTETFTNIPNNASSTLTLTNSVNAKFVKFTATENNNGNRVGVKNIMFNVSSTGEQTTPTTPNVYNAPISADNIIVRPASASLVTKAVENITDDTVSLSNLYDGTSNNPSGQTWFTKKVFINNSTTADSDYFDRGFSPSIDFNMPSEGMYDSFSIWGYQFTGNLMNDFILELFNSSDELIFADEFKINQSINNRQYATFSLGGNYLFSKARMTILDNYSGDNRVGFTEIAFYQEPYYFVNSPDISANNWTINGTDKQGVQFTEGGDSATFAGGVTMTGAGEFNIGTGRTLTLSNVISGDGALTKTGNGTLLLTNANSYEGGTTVSAGTLVLSENGTLGTGAVVNNAALVFAHDSDLTFNNAVSGAGIVSKTGAGKLKIDATENLFQSSQFTVEAGELDFKGNYSGNLYVKSGATLSPGNSVGDLAVSGNVVIDDNGTILFEFGSYNNGSTSQNYDTLAITNADDEFSLDTGSIVRLYFEGNDASVWAADNAEYLLVSDPGFVSEETSFNSLLGNYQDLFGLQGRADGLYLISLGAGPGPSPEPGSGVPEPSTWALLLLGAAGLLYVRKRTRK